MNGIFVAFEGGEGSGKTTQIRLLGQFLRSQGRDVLETKEPGGDEGICQSIRGILLDPAHKGVLDDRAELLLFLADRAQHVSRVILPALKKGSVVLCDRYAASTFAYQCSARNVADKGLIKTLNAFTTGQLAPHITVFLDIDPKKGLLRRGNDLDRIDGENMEFHKMVQRGFYDFFSNEGWPYVTIDADQSIEHVQKEIQQKILELIQT